MSVNRRLKKQNKQNAPTELPKLADEAKKDILIAYHEAGHTVMSFILKQKFSFVTTGKEQIKEDAGGGVHTIYGRVHNIYMFEQFFTTGSFLSYFGTFKALEKTICILAAGIIAEELLAEQKGWNCKKYWTMGHSLCEGSDFNKITKILYNFYIHNNLVEAYLKYVRLVVKYELKDPLFWKCVEAVAKILLKEKKIGYKKARSIIKGSLQDTSKNKKEYTCKF